MSLFGLSRDIDLTRCYTCGRKLDPNRFAQHSFFGRAADYAGFPRCMVNFCPQCGVAAFAKYQRAVEATKGETYAACAANIARSAKANAKSDDDDDD